MDDKQTRESELSALLEACDNFSLNHGSIVAGYHEEEINQQGVMHSFLEMGSNLAISMIGFIKIFFFI